MIGLANNLGGERKFLANSCISSLVGWLTVCNVPRDREKVSGLGAVCGTHDLEPDFDFLDFFLPFLSSLTMVWREDRVLLMASMVLDKESMSFFQGWD